MQYVHRWPLLIRIFTHCLVWACSISLLSGVSAAAVACTGSVTAGSGPALTATNQFTQSGGLYSYSNSANTNYSGLLSLQLNIPSITVDTLANTGELCGGSYSLYMSRSNNLTTLNNSGLMSGGTANGIFLQGGSRDLGLVRMWGLF